MGHQLRRWHPNMEPYIFAAKKNIHIVDLEKTDEGLKAATEFLYETAKRGEQIIFVGTKKQAQEIVEIEAKRCGALYVTERWLGGTLTNFSVIKKNSDKLVKLLKQREEGELAKYTKKEQLLIDREIEKLQRFVGGIVTLKGAPSAIFVVDVKREKTAVREAARLETKVVGLVDTNSDPSDVDFVIPGNDDAIKAIAIIVKTVADCVETGYKAFAEDTAKAVEVEAKAKAKEEAEAEKETAETETEDSESDKVESETSKRKKKEK